MAAGAAPAGPHRRPVPRSPRAGGYQRLENQLYRVQVHDDARAPRREPTGRSCGRATTAASWPACDALEPSTARRRPSLTLDRLGRDEELSFAAGHLVEVTSTRPAAARAARASSPGTGPPDRPRRCRVTWLGTAPAGARRPRARRRSCAAGTAGRRRSTHRRDRSGGRDRGPVPGRRASRGTGDYWLIPARTVRLAYGLDPAQRHDRLAAGRPAATSSSRPPASRTTSRRWRSSPGPAPAGDRSPTAGGCSRPLTGLVTIDLVGGDGQEAMPGDPLPEPVRVAVRNGGAAGRRSAGRGSRAGDGRRRLADRTPRACRPGDRSTAVTGADGVARCAGGSTPPAPTTQTLTLRRLDDHGRPVDVAVVVTGRLSVARQVAWDPPSASGSRDTRTVQDALGPHAATRELRLLGGDGQEVREPGDGGAAAGPGGRGRQPVRAGRGGGGHGPGGRPHHRARVSSRRRRRASPPRPPSTGAGAADHGRETGEDGVAAFWWQPAFGNGLVDRSTSAWRGPATRRSGWSPNLDAGGSAGRTAGVHIDEPHLRQRTTVPERRHGRPRGPRLGDPGRARRARRRGDGRREAGGAGRARAAVAGGRRDGIWTRQARSGSDAVEIAAERRPTGTAIHLGARPRGRQVAGRGSAGSGPAAGSPGGRSSAGSSSTAGRSCPEKDPGQHLNGHAEAFVDDGRAAPLLRLPTDDEVTGGTFVQWFRLARVAERRSAAVPDVVGRTTAAARSEIEALGLVVDTVSEPSGERRGRVLRVDPAPGTALLEGDTVSVVLSKGRSG